MGESLIDQRQHEDHDARKPEQSLYDGGGKVADEDAACRVGGAAPVGSRGAGLLLALASAFEVLAEKDPCDGAEDEAEQGAYAEEEESDQGACDAADGPAHGAPGARPKRRAPYEVATKSATKAIAAKTNRTMRIATPTERKSVRVA